MTPSFPRYCMKAPLSVPSVHFINLVLDNEESPCLIFFPSFSQALQAVLTPLRWRPLRKTSQMRTYEKKGRMWENVEEQYMRTDSNKGTLVSLLPLHETAPVERPMAPAPRLLQLHRDQSTMDTLRILSAEHRLKETVQMTDSLKPRLVMYRYTRNLPM